MKIFIDSANIDEIKKANEFGIIDGVTTNPSLIAKEKNINFEDIIREIVDTVKGPISVEIMSTETKEMIKEARNLSKISDKIVVKIPLTFEGLKAIKIIGYDEIKTNATLIFSANQALLAAKAGADFVSIFIGRLDDIGEEGMQVVRDTVNIFDNYDIDTEIITASVRHPIHVLEAAKAGTDIATIPFIVIEKMIKHSLTDIGIERFLKDWKMTKE